MVVLTLAMVAALIFNSAVMAITWTTKVDEFVVNNTPEDVSPDNYPNGQYLWSGHQSRGTIAYTFLQFDLGEGNYENLSLSLFTNAVAGTSGTTKIWLNPNNTWGGSDVYWNNLASLWDYTHPILAGEKYISDYGWDTINISEGTSSGILSLVIGSILPNEAIPVETYWRDFQNLQFSPTSPGIILEGFPASSSAVPESGTIVLLGFGLIALSSQIRQRKSA